jgi:hypothetical protein
MLKDEGFQGNSVVKTGELDKDRIKTMNTNSIKRAKARAKLRIVKP